MKPAWIYDKELKKYVVIPYHCMKTFDDGAKGFTIYGDQDKELLEFVRRNKKYFYEEDQGFYSRIIFTQHKSRLRLKDGVPLVIGSFALLMIGLGVASIIIVLIKALGKLFG